MKPKPTIDPNAAGDEVLRLLGEDVTAKAALKDMRSAKAARKEQLKQALAIVWDAFERGETVNGCATRKQWCREFAKVTPRHAEHILYGRKKQTKKANSSSPKADHPLLSRIAETKKALAEIQRQIYSWEDGETQETRAPKLKALLAQIDPIINGAFAEFLATLSPEGYQVRQGDTGKWYLTEKREDAVEEEKPKRSAAAKKAAKTKAAKKVIHRFTTIVGEYGLGATPSCGAPWTVDDRMPRKRNGIYPEPTCAECNRLWDEEQARSKAEWEAEKAAAPTQPLGECEWCGDGTPATETYTMHGSTSTDNLCAECAASSRKLDREYLRRQMSPAKCYGKFYSWKRLRDDRKESPDPDDDKRILPNKLDYLESLKKHFLGNPEFDQTVVAEYVAEVEAKMPKATAQPAPQPLPPSGLSAPAKALAAVVGADEREAAPEACKDEETTE
jgi:hypothetical protein